MISLVQTSQYRVKELLRYVESLNAQEETKQRIFEIAEELEYEVRTQKKP